MVEVGDARWLRFLWLLVPLVLPGWVLVLPGGTHLLAPSNEHLSRTFRWALQPGMRVLLPDSYTSGG